MDEPTVTPRPTAPAGPWKWLQARVLLPLGLATLVVLVVALHFFPLLHTPAETAQEKAARQAAQQFEQTTPPNPQDVAGFRKQTAQTATQMGKEATSAANLSKLLAQGVGTPGATSPLAVPGNPLNTDPALYKAWVDADATARQANSTAPGGSFPSTAPGNTPESAAGGVSTAQQKREEARKREQQRLMASSIAIDFTKQTTDKPESTVVLPAATSNTSASVPALASTSTEEKEPKLLPAHTCTDLCEGDLIETVLTNRIDGSQAGFADVIVTQPVFSHDWDPQGRRLLIPAGSRVLGNVTAVNSTQQQRLFVAFHKLRRPDGSTFSLDNFTGLDMAGAAGLRDLVNHHYLQIFGVSGAIAAIGAVAQIGNATNAFSYDPGVAIRNGLSQQLGQESMQILNRFLNQPPTMIVREGKNLVKVYISQDLHIPPYLSRKEITDAP